MNIDEFKTNIESHAKAYIEELSKGTKGEIKAYELRPNKGYETIAFCNSAIIRIVPSKTKGIHLHLSEKYLDLFGLEKEAQFTKSDPDWGKLLFNESVAVKILDNIKSVFERCYLNESVERFGCCSRYEECSDEQKCIHPDIRFAEGCYYKINLENGRIFYGKNCNIDHSPK
jgi:hypothetical protein